MKEYKQVLDTNSDMWCIWNPLLGNDIYSYKDWENKFYEEQHIIKYIKEKLFVPINIGNSGTFEFKIRVGENVILTEREQSYRIVKSHTFWIKATGKLFVSGIEYIEQEINQKHTCSINLDEGIYKVDVSLIDWKKETDMIDENGLPKEGALSDFMILLNKENDNKTKNIETIQTFPPPSNR